MNNKSRSYKAVFLETRENQKDFLGQENHKSFLRKDDDKNLKDEDET